MAYTLTNYKTKKALVEDFKRGKDIILLSHPLESHTDSDVTIEGPHYPKPHSWYARVHVVNGRITKIY